VEERFRAQARDFGLADRILQLPFLPHWRVPEFIRGCLAICCLEQDFPIGFRTPIILREVLLCGTCLVAATEVIRKLPGYSQLPHGFGCVAIEDVNDVDTLSKRLAAIVADPAPALQVGARGREFACALQRAESFPHGLERALEAAAAGRPIRSDGPPPVDAAAAQQEAGSRFRLCQLAAGVVECTDWDAGTARKPLAATEIPDLPWARELLAAIKQRIADGHQHLLGLVPAVEAEIAVAAAECDADATSTGEPDDPLFRLRIERWGVTADDLAGLICVRDPHLRALAFDFDVGALAAVRTAEDLAKPPASRRSYIVAFGRPAGRYGGRRDPLIIDAAAARILDLSDGTRRACEIVAELNREGRLVGEDAAFKRIESLFAHGLILLRDKRLNVVRDDRPAVVELGFAAK
jgi:hypothetical protein